MKRSIGFVFLVALFSCEEPTVISEYTGNEITYELRQASDYVVGGTVSFRERIDGATSVVIQLSGTDGAVKHPVHLHLGSIATPKADVAALLSPVSGSSGRSETILRQLADETPIDYLSLKQLNACIKIHLSDTGEGRDVILAGGDIGQSYVSGLAGGRQRGFALCVSAD